MASQNNISETLSSTRHKLRRMLALRGQFPIFRAPRLRSEVWRLFPAGLPVGFVPVLWAKLAVNDKSSRDGAWNDREEFMARPISTISGLCAAACGRRRPDRRRGGAGLPARPARQGLLRRQWRSGRRHADRRRRSWLIRRPWSSAYTPVEDPRALHRRSGTASSSIWKK